MRVVSRWNQCKQEVLKSMQKLRRHTIEIKTAKSMYTQPLRPTSTVQDRLCQPAHPVENWRILLVQKLYCRMPLLTPTSAFGLGRRRWSSPRQCYLLYTVSALQCATKSALHAVKFWSSVQFMGCEQALLTTLCSGKTTKPLPSRPSPARPPSLRPSPDLC